MEMKWVPPAVDPKRKSQNDPGVILHNVIVYDKMNSKSLKVIPILQKVVLLTQNVISEMKMSLPPPPCRMHNMKYGYSRIWMAATNSFPFAKLPSAEWKWPSAEWKWPSIGRISLVWSHFHFANENEFLEKRNGNMWSAKAFANKWLCRHACFHLFGSSFSFQNQNDFIPKWVCQWKVILI